MVAGVLQHKEKCGVVIWGDLVMRNIATICMIAVVSLSGIPTAQAVRRVVPQSGYGRTRRNPFPTAQAAQRSLSREPFVSVSFKPDEIDLGSLKPTVDGLPAQLKAHIIANCPHQIEVSFTPFKGKRGHTIPANETIVTINKVRVPVGRDRVPIITSDIPTPRNGVEIPLELRFHVDAARLYPMGQYEGTLAFTVTAASP